MALRSPLGRVRGLGSAKEGVEHFWQQRITALGLVPLTVWFVISVISLAGADYATWKTWIGHPGNTALMLILIGFVFHHGQLGLQVVIEDYVHGEGAKLAWLLTMKFATLILAVFAALSVLRVALAGG